MLWAPPAVNSFPFGEEHPQSLSRGLSLGQVEENVFKWCWLTVIGTNFETSHRAWLVVVHLAVGAESEIYLVVSEINIH